MRYFVLVALALAPAPLLLAAQNAEQQLLFLTPAISKTQIVFEYANDLEYTAMGGYTKFAGSGGDTMPWYFRKAGVGPLVGKKTCGGLVGIGGYPALIDGGHVTAPRWAFYGLTGQWEVENHGIVPDIEVEQDPKLVQEGHDPQLERAVTVALEMPKKNPPSKFERPSYPNYHQSFSGGTSQ